MSKRLFIIFILTMLAGCSTVTVIPPTHIPSETPQNTVFPTGEPITDEVIPTFVPATNSGKPFSFPFPRLGMWWPDTSKQSLDDIARYDWVILGDWDKSVIPELKKLNPNLLVLNSTNACELSYNPDPNADPQENADVRDIPAEWFLTQVGTTITTNIDSFTTTIPVADLQSSNGSETINLFVAGDTAVIDGESLYIEKVDPNTRTLQVKRGFVRPASAHPAGTRIAAHISFWPNSWVMNLSTLSPTSSIDPNQSPEGWSSYNSRQAASLLSDPIWDGILLDRSDPNESWLLSDSNARSIDPDQSNRLLTDYSEFDSTWNAGLVAYESGLRYLVGNEKLILTNWGMPNYSLLNGNNFEGFPGDITDENFSTNWHRQIFGPDHWSGSYSEWIKNAMQPNLSMIETYEDNSGPEPGSDGSYQNPCADPSFKPDYRKMRFGLGTALLNDGFFSYEMNTNGHGSLCLLWFDEYDGGGLGRGYLGQPIGEAFTIDTGEKAEIPLSKNPAEWFFWFDDTAGYQADLQVNGSVASIIVTKALGTEWQISYSHPNIIVQDGYEYSLLFKAKSDQTHEVSMWIQQVDDPWATLVDFGSLQVTSDWQDYTIHGVSVQDDPNAELFFGLGGQTGSVSIDQVRLIREGKSVWRRDFENGIVLLNATSDVQIIDLDQEFRKLSGRQDIALNNGDNVKQITLPPLDAIILLKIR